LSQSSRILMALAIFLLSFFSPANILKALSETLGKNETQLFRMFPLVLAVADPAPLKGQCHEIFGPPHSVARGIAGSCFL
jgi:hypothetical protein